MIEPDTDTDTNQTQTRRKCGSFAKLQTDRYTGGKKKNKIVAIVTFLAIILAGITNIAI